MFASCRHVNFASALVACLATTPVDAAPVLDHLPDDAYGFVLLRNLAELDADVGRLAGELQLPMPQPLTFLQAAARVGTGLQLDGEALVAFLPGNQGVVDARPLVLLPVSDYARFVEPLHGDPSGDICRITVLGEEVLIARDGDYALLMNLEHEPLMAQLLRIDPERVATLDPLAAWIGANDVVAGLLPAGMEALIGWGRSTIAAQQLEIEERYAGQDNAAMHRALHTQLKLFQMFLDFCDAEAQTVALGIAVDSEANLVVSKRVMFAPNGNLGQVQCPARVANPLIDWSQESFVAAGGGALAASDWDLVARAATALMRQFPHANGFEQLTDDDWERVAESNSALVDGLQSASLLVVPGQPADPIYSNLYLTLTVEDVDAYFAAYQRSFELWNQVMARSTDPSHYVYQMEPTQIQGRRALVAKADIGAATAEPNVPFMQNFMEIMFGDDAVLRVYLIQVDDHKVLVSVAGIERATQRLASLGEKSRRLQDAEDNQTALALVDSQAAFRAIVSLQGCANWQRRQMEAILALGAGGQANVPKIPDVPPIGLSFHLADAQLRTELAWPAATLRAASKVAKFAWYGSRR